MSVYHSIREAVLAGLEQSLPAKLLLMNETDSIISWDKIQDLFVR